VMKKTDFYKHLIDFLLILGQLLQKKKTKLRWKKSKNTSLNRFIYNQLLWFIIRFQSKKCISLTFLCIAHILYQRKKCLQLKNTFFTNVNFFSFRGINLNFHVCINYQLKNFLLNEEIADYLTLLYLKMLKWFKKIRT